jgi:hypothetical protein
VDQERPGVSGEEQAASGSVRREWAGGDPLLLELLRQDKQTNKHLRCGIRTGLLGRNDQTDHRMEPKQMAL